MNKLLFIALLLLGTNSLAATWEKVGENNASKYYFDSDSITPVNFKGKNIIKAWEKVVVKKPTGNTYKINDEVLSLTYFDCGSRLSGTKEIVTKRNGREIEDLSVSTNYPSLNDVVPESATEATFNSVCATYQINTGTRSYMKLNGE
ncbi:surface-adhesin E family protein [Acinetobacter baumannii]